MLRKIARIIAKILFGIMIFLCLCLVILGIAVLFIPAATFGIRLVVAIIAIAGGVGYGLAWIDIWEET